MKPRQCPKMVRSERLKSLLSYSGLRLCTFQRLFEVMLWTSHEYITLLFIKAAISFWLARVKREAIALKVTFKTSHHKAMNARKKKGAAALINSIKDAVFSMAWSISCKSFSKHSQPYYTGWVFLQPFKLAQVSKFYFCQINEEDIGNGLGGQEEEQVNGQIRKDWSRMKKITEKCWTSSFPVRIEIKGWRWGWA